MIQHLAITKEKSTIRVKIAFTYGSNRPRGDSFFPEFESDVSREYWTYCWDKTDENR